MTFEPAKVLQSVVEFYYSSGIISINENTVQIRAGSVAQVQGARQKYEQILFFILGSLLPEFTPLIVELGTVSGHQGEKYLRTGFQLPAASNASLARLRDSMDQDERLKKLLGLSEAKLADSPAGFAGCSLCLGLDFPVEAVSIVEAAKILDIGDLRTRYEDPETAFTLLEGFVMNARRHLALLTAAAEKQDWTEAHRHAHALKGGALTICAEPFAQKAKNIETAIKESRYSEVLPAIGQLESACTELESAWAEHREELHG